ncbi:MAG: M36 family metallopeptidase, partial [Actinomycetes bacterium]
MRRRPTTRHIVAAGAALAVTAAILPPAAATIADPVGDSSAPAVQDSRDTDSVLAPTGAQLDAVRALVSAAPSGARATWDERFGTPRTVVGRGGYLTGPRSGSAVDVARAWVSDNRAAFGLSDAQVSALAMTRDHTLPGTGTHVVTLTQVFDG